MRKLPERVVGPTWSWARAIRSTTCRRCARRWGWWRAGGGMTASSCRRCCKASRSDMRRRASRS